MESRLRPQTAAVDGMSICERHCHSSFYNNMRPFLKYYVMSFLLTFPMRNLVLFFKDPSSFEHLICPIVRTMGKFSSGWADGIPAEEPL
jgi:hypothetical protein